MNMRNDLFDAGADVLTTERLLMKPLIVGSSVVSSETTRANVKSMNDGI